MNKNYKKSQQLPIKLDKISFPLSRLPALRRVFSFFFDNVGVRSVGCLLDYGVCRNRQENTI